MFRTLKFLCSKICNNHNILWRSGIYIFLVALVSNALVFLPLFPYLDGIGRIQDVEVTKESQTFMNSTAWHFSLVSNIALSLPISLDFVLDIMHIKISKLSTPKYAEMPLMVLIYSLIFPNLLILVVAIPARHNELVFCLMFHRALCLYYGIMGYLWGYGGDVFRKPLFMTGHLCFSVSFILFAYDTISNKQVTSLYWLAVAFLCLAIILMIHFLIKFFILLRKIGFQNIKPSQISCVIYLIISILLGVACLCAFVVFGGHYDVAFMTIFTYMEAGFTLLLAMLRGRLIRAEINNKKVN